MLYDVQVPPGVQPGQQFRIMVNGQQMTVQCPQGAAPGSTIRINVGASAPAQQHQAQHQQHVQPPPPQQNVNPNDPSAIFDMIDKDRSGYITAKELQQVFQRGGQKFSLKACKLMVGLHDVDKTGKIDKKEFVQLDKYIRDWQTCFNSIDHDRSGKIDTKELSTAMKSFGYRFSDSFMQFMVSAYDEDRSGTIEFDEFIQIFVELQMLTEKFKEKDEKKNGVATFHYEEFLRVFYTLRG